MSDNLTRLSRVLGMLGSEHDGEVLNAGRMAERIRHEMDKSWAVLLSGSSSTNSGEVEFYRMRAIRAEHRAALAEGRAIRSEERAVSAETKASQLEARVASLEWTIREMQSSKPSSSTSPPRERRSETRKRAYASSSLPPRYRLSAMVMAELVTALKQGWCSSYKVYSITKWQRANLSLRLTQIANERGLTLKSMPARYGKGLIYRFEEND